MSDISKKVLSILSRNKKGLKAKEIADLIGSTRKEVNHFLYYEQNEYKKIDGDIWVKKNTFNLRDDPVLSKLKNIDNGKKFTLNYFRGIADWRYGKSQSKYKPKGTYITKTGNKIDYDSKIELEIMEYLEDNDLVIEMGGQSLCLGYDSIFKDGKSYYPDLVVLTKDYRIAIIEIKPATAMSYHLNIEKYAALEEYCLENGYLYMMIDPALDYMTLDELEDLYVYDELIEIFDELESKKKKSKTPICFTDADVRKWYDDICFDDTKKDFDLMVHSLIVYYNWYNKYKNGFLVYSCPVH